MMNTTGIGFSALWAIHILSVIVFFTGVLFFIVLAIKTFTHAQLKIWAVWLLILGTVGCLFTIGLMGHPWIGYITGGDAGYGRMMVGGNGLISDDGAQAKEEADGKALYEKLQAKQVNCQDLKDSDFELIGEYVMGQRAGASHDQMNAMMKQMMGTDGEEQMHIIMGKSLSGCSGTSQSFGQGMMNGVGMMGRSANNSSEPRQVDTHHSSVQAQ